MPSFGQRLEAELGPAWGAAGAAVGALYATWPVLHLHDTLVVKSRDGMGWMPLIIFGFLGFVFTLAIAGGLLTTVLGWVESPLARGSLVLALTSLFDLD